MLSFLNGILGSRTKSRRSHKSSSRHSSLKKVAAKDLRIEPLEQRQLLSVATWTGGGTSANWNDQNNWKVNGVQGYLLQNNDSVIFSGTQRTSTNNNIQNLSLNSIEFSSNSFALAGNSITVGNGGITVDSGITGSTISFGISLGGTITVNGTSGTQLSVSGAILGTNGLTKAGGGALSLSALTITRARLRSVPVRSRWERPIPYRQEQR